VTVTINGTPYTVCYDPTPVVGPIIALAIDVLVRVFNVVGTLKTNFVDPTACPALQQFAGTNLPGIISIDAQGDVYVAGGFRFYNCPPY
jgi:hypothetical protein